jgi:Co/Zn/Cd efflux system component
MPESGRWRRALWIALLLNAGFFVVEIVAGLAAGSAALLGDALDFFGDAANYAVSLGAARRAPRWRARAALAKAGTMILLALWVLANTILHAIGTLPDPRIMVWVAAAALLANGGLALMLSRFRGGDANMRSAWICARNDALGNLAVLLAAVGIFGTRSSAPDFGRCLGDERSRITRRLAGPAASAPRTGLAGS